MDMLSRVRSFSAKDQAGNDVSEKVSGEIEALIQMTRLDQIAPGRYSILLVLNLFGAFKSGMIDPNLIVREIEALEKGETTGLKPPIQNRYPPLKGLWHKHYMLPGLGSMAMNIQNAMRKFGIPYLKEKVREAEAAKELRYFSVEDVGPLVQDVIQGNLERRRQNQELTGEWIVFAKHEGKNYYLCLATHVSSTHQNIRQQIDALCCLEFPFLEKLLADEG